MLLGRLSAAARTASANVYGHWGATTYSGTRSWYAGGGVAGTTASGSYYNSRTGTSGTYNAGRQYNAWTGNATRGYDRTMNTAPPAAPATSRARSNYNTYTGQRSTGSTRVGNRRRRQHLPIAPARRPPGPEATRTSAEARPYNAKTGKTNTWGTAERRQQSLRRRQRQRLQEHRRRLAAAFVERAGTTLPGDTSWANKESQARSERR